MKRDLSHQQFVNKATKLGFKSNGLLGYWSLANDPSINVSVYNAGKRRRDWLKYLIQQDNKYRPTVKP